MLSLGAASCGGGDDGGLAGGGDGPGVVPAEKPGDQLTISQWPLYVDPGKDGTIAQFEGDSGIDVKYVEEINDNNEFFGKIQPLLADGESDGRSLITLSDWLATKMYGLGYLYELDKAKLPNVEKNLIPALRHPAADPDRKFTVPWQSGMTGLIVRSDLAPDVTSVNDLFDPKYKGKVSMLSELRDTVPLVMKADGVDPEDADKEDWLAAIDKINDAVESGQIRDITGNDYIASLPRGDIVAAIGWSGDGYLIGRDDVEWRRPEEGCGQWFDMMTIPVGRPTPPRRSSGSTSPTSPRCRRTSQRSSTT